MQKDRPSSSPVESTTPSPTGLEWGTAPSAGGLLRQAREGYKLTIDQVARTLCISSTYIEAIEEHNFRRLPTPPYVYGFVKSYARFLRLDEEAITTLFKAEMPRNDNQPVFQIPVAISFDSLPKPTTIAACTFIVILIGWILARLHMTPPVQTPEVYDQNLRTVIEEDYTARNTLPVPTLFDIEDIASTDPFATEMLDDVVLYALDPMPEPAAAPVDQESLITAQPAPEGLSIVAKSACWLELRGPGNVVILEQTLKRGEKLDLPMGPYRLTLGNAGGVTVYANGQPLEALGEKGEVIHEIPLDDLIKNP